MNLDQFVVGVVDDDPHVLESIEELLVSAWVVLSSRRKRVVLVADEEDLTPVPAPIGFDLADSCQHGALKVMLHKRADDLGQTRIRSDREVEGAYGTAFDQLPEGWNWPAVWHC